MEGLPFLVEKGIVSSIQIEIPWTSLGKSPVIVRINGVYVQLSPLDAASTPLKVLEAMERESKGCKLQAIEDTAYLLCSNNEKKSTKTSSSSSSYFQQLIAQIVDNLEIHVSNVHIRYEDSISMPNLQPFSAGLLLKSFVLLATDANWTPGFIPRDKKNKKTSLFKLAKLQNLGIYLNPTSSVAVNSSSVSWSDWITQMKAPFISTATSSLKEFEILPISNTASLKMTLHPHHDRYLPKLEISIAVSDFFLRLSNAQLTCILALKKTLSEFDRRQVIRLYRPRQNAKKDPAAWWSYVRWRLTGRQSSYSLRVTNHI